MYYVAQENLEAISEDQISVVNNPDAVKYFKEYNIWEKKFICKEKYSFAYDQTLTTPCTHQETTGVHTDTNPVLSVEDEEKQIQRTHFTLIEAALLDVYNHLECSFLSGRIGDNPRIDMVEKYRNNVDKMTQPYRTKRNENTHSKKYQVQQPQQQQPQQQQPQPQQPLSIDSSSSWLRNNDLLSLLQAAPDRHSAHIIENIKWLCWMVASNRCFERYMREGVTQLARGRNEQALQLFKDAMALQPDQTEVYNKISAICYVKEEYANAISNANMALKFDSKHYAASAMLGLALLKTTNRKSIRNRECLCIAYYLCLYVHVCMFVYIYVYVCIRMYVCKYVCVYVYVYVCIFCIICLCMI